MPEAPAATSVTLAIVARASPAMVWQAIVDPERTPRWVGGFRFETAWVVGGSFALTGVLQGRPYTERGLLLALETGRLLRFAHWSRLWGVPDLPANRAVVTLTLEEEGDATRVGFRHDLPGVVALAQHSAFFWRVGLEQLRRLAEEG